MNKELGQLMTWVLREKAAKQFTSPLKEWNYWQGYIDALQKVRVEIHKLNEEISESEADEEFCVCKEPDLEGTRFCYKCQKKWRP